MRKTPKLWRLLLWTGAGLSLALVSLAYLRPNMALALATQLWNCF